MFSKTSEELLNEMLSNVDDSYQKTTGFPTYDYLKALAVVLAPITEQMDVVAGKLDVNNLEGTELDRFVSERSIITRRTASKAEATVLVDCTGDVVIPQGTLFETESGLQFATTIPFSLANALFVNIPVECVVGGTIGNVGANTITKIPMTIANVVAVTNPRSATGGYEEETDEALRARYFAQMQTPATSGNVFHYQQWANSIAGVGASKVFPLWSGANTVQVVIVNDEMKAPDSSLVAEVQNYIDPGKTGEGRGVAPIGAKCTVTGATEMSINVTVQISKGELYPSVDIAPKITEYLRNIAFKQDYVSVGMIGNAIMNTDGVLDYNNLKINNQTANVTIPAKSVAVLGTVTVNEL